MAPSGIAQHVDNRPEDSSGSSPTGVQVLVASPSIQVHDFQVRISASAVVAVVLAVVVLIYGLRR